MTNIELYINNNKWLCNPPSDGEEVPQIDTSDISIPKKIAEYLITDNFLSEYNTELEKNLVMLNILLFDNVPKENSTKLVDSGTVYKIMREGKLERDQLTELINNLYGIKADKDELFSKKYTDLTDVPTKLSEFINDLNFQSQELIADNYYNKQQINSIQEDLQEYIDSLELVQSDWNESNSNAESFIKNKPTKLSLFTNDSGYITSNLLLSNLEEILEDFVSDEFVTKDELGDYITREELFDMLNPFKITISVNPNFLERTGEVRNITITVSPKKGNLGVTPDTCQISYGGNTYNFTGYYTALVSLSTSFTVTCTYKSETSSASGSVSFVYPSYFGFAETSDFNSVDTSQLAKDVRASILCTKTLNNTVAGSYLWIVTPYSLNTVATDPGYTYKVAMILAGNKDNLNYYRSNSAIDVSNLTYYIK